MKSIKNTATPYISDLPLCETTDWLAIPLCIQVKSNSYSSALAKTKDLNHTLNTVCHQASSSVSVYRDDDPHYEDLSPSLHFEKSDGEYSAILYRNLVIELDSEQDFWGKMEAVSLFIDEVNQFTEQFKTNKSVEIEVGQKSLLSNFEKRSF